MLKKGALLGSRRLATRGLVFVALIAGAGGGLAASMPWLTAAAAGTTADTVAVSSSLPNANYGDQITFTATVTSAAAPAPTGSVTFTASKPSATSQTGFTTFKPVCAPGGSNIVALNGGSATCTPQVAVPGGTYASTAACPSCGVIASYSGDPTYAANVSSTSQTVAGLATTTTIANNGPTTVNQGQAASFKATIARDTVNSPPDGRPQAPTVDPPGGSAAFFANSFTTPSGQAGPPASSGPLPDCAKVPLSTTAGVTTASCTTVDLPVGTDNVLAEYHGDGSYKSSHTTTGAQETVNPSQATTTTTPPTTTPPTTTPPTTAPPKQQGGGGQAGALPGYWMVGSDGGIFNFGPGANFFGSTGATHLNAPIVGVAEDSVTGGYWLAASDGGVFAFNAHFYGSMGGSHLNAPVVGIAAAPDGHGYWLVASDGGVFAFGTAAHFYGSTGGIHLNKPVVGIAAAPDGQGYWLVASDGGVFNFGPGAAFYGSTGAIHLNKPVVGIAAVPNPTGHGYWLVASDGGVFNFGPGARFLGSTGAIQLNKPVVGIGAAGSHGYWLVASDGGIFNFGPDATFYGSMGGTRLNGPIVGMASAG